MCEPSKDIEVREYILRVLLTEVLKDGKIEQEEKETVSALGPVLNLTADRSIVIRNEVVKNLGAIDGQGSLSYVDLFRVVRKKLLEKYPPEATDDYLEMLAEKMNQKAEFMEALAFGF